MPSLCEAADEPPRLAVDVALEVGQGFFTVGALGLALEQENRQRPKQGQVARHRGVTHRAAVLVLGAVPAIVLPIFDAPVVAGQFEQSVRVRLLGPQGGEGKAHVVGFFDHLAAAHRLGVAVDAQGLSHSG